jgi:hypothetical protein
MKNNVTISRQPHKPFEPTVEWSLKIIASRGVDPTLPWYPTGIASIEELRVARAADFLSRQPEDYREVVGSILEWVESRSVRWRVINSLERIVDNKRK